jgi:hypothetical protein
VGERKEDRGREELAGLHALEGEARVVTAPPERSVLEDHRAGRADLARDREPLHEAQGHEEEGGEQADLRVRRQEPDRDRRAAHEEQAEEEDRLAAVGVAPVAEDERAHRPRHVADAVGRERRDDRDRGVLRGKEELGEDERGRGRVDEEVVVLERAANPTAGGRLLRRLLVLRWFVRARWLEDCVLHG